MVEWGFEGDQMKFKRTFINGMIVHESIVYIPIFDFDYSVLDRQRLTFEKRDSEPNVLYYLPTEKEKALIGIKGNMIKFKRM